VHLVPAAAIYFKRFIPAIEEKLEWKKAIIAEELLR
jgi:hypothetical protein